MTARSGDSDIEGNESHDLSKKKTSMKNRIKLLSKSDNKSQDSLEEKIESRGKIRKITDVNTDSVDSSKSKVDNVSKKKHKGPSLSRFVGFKIKLAPNPNSSISTVNSVPVMKSTLQIENRPPDLKNVHVVADPPTEIDQDITSPLPKVTLRRKYLKNDPNNKEQLDLALAVIPRRRPDKSQTLGAGALFDLNREGGLTNATESVFTSGGAIGFAANEPTMTSSTGKSCTLPAGYISSWASFEDGVSTERDEILLESALEIKPS